MLLLPGCAEELAATYTPVLQRRRDTLRIVPAHRVHLTLAWVADPPAAALTNADRAGVRAAVDTALAGVMPLAKLAPIGVEEARCAPYGVRCELHEPDAVVDLAHAVTDAFARALPGADVSRPRPDSHIALAYGTHADSDVTDLAEQLRAAAADSWTSARLTLGDPALVIVEADTFGETPWDWMTLGTR